MQFQSDLINVSSYGKEKFDFNEERGEISFYCKDCKEMVETERKVTKKTKYRFVCKKCQGKNIAIGTQEGLKEFYSGKR